MSTKGIYTALSGAIAQQSKMDTIANNLANANTTSFKKDRQVFQEYLTAYEKSPDVIQVPKVPASIESFYHMQGGDKGFVDASATFTDFGQGSLQQTGNPLDLAIHGQATFFEISTPQGIRYTRNGAFVVNSEGLLTTKQGYPVLSSAEGDVEQRLIRIPSTGPLSVTPNATLFINDTPIGRLKLTRFEEPNGLRKIGNSLYVEKESVDPGRREEVTAQVLQGSLEMSNVNVVEEMTEMIKTTRTFENLQKAIQAYDQMNGKLVNDVPKF